MFFELQFTYQPDSRVINFTFTIYNLHRKEERDYGKGF